MQSKIADSGNALELIRELDRATSEMMALRVNEVGSPLWREALVRQQNAFRKWCDYLYEKAEEPPSEDRLSLA